MDNLNWIGLKWIAMVNLQNVGPPFFKFISVYIKCHLHSWKIILSCYVAMILQMKDSCSANLTFRAHN